MGTSCPASHRQCWGCLGGCDSVGGAGSGSVVTQDGGECARAGAARSEPEARALPKRRDPLVRLAPLLLMLGAVPPVHACVAVWRQPRQQVLRKGAQHHLLRMASSDGLYYHAPRIVSSNCGGGKAAVQPQQLQPHTTTVW